MKINHSILNHLPPEQHDRFVRNANEIVIESFVLTGDRDYLTARFAFFQKQSHLFLWSAAQALEKYIKANILLLGGGVIQRTHHHTKLAKTLRETHADRLEIDTAVPDGWAQQGVALCIPLHTSHRLAKLPGVAGALDKDGYLLQAQP